MMLHSLLLLLAATAAASAAVATCPRATADCTIADLAGLTSGRDLLAALAPGTRRLRLRNLGLRDDDWTEAEGRQLESLQLDGVALEGGSCPRLGRAFARLTELSVGPGCKLAALNDTWLAGLTSLRRLTVAGAKVESLQLAGVAEATRLGLEEIRLADNSFNRLTNDAFGYMPRLRNLTLDGNIIQYIQEGAFSQLPSLVQLSIILPKEGQLLAKIWEATLDGRFDNNTQLETLQLVNARLAEEQIPGTFERLKLLRRLDLSGNRFRRLHNSVLSSLTSLEHLDLSNGSLVCLYDRNFGVMGRLKRLSLAHNAIRVVGQRALLGLHSLEGLDLAGNPLLAIERGAFCSLPAIVKDAPDLLASWDLEPDKVAGSANLSDPCPPDFDPNRLILSSKPQCLLRPRDDKPPAIDKPPLDQQSRHTFLIIIGLCVAFLIVTVISMMAYKGWSKRKNAQLARDEEKELELQAMVAAAEDGGPAGKKPPHNNGRQHHHHHHHQHKSGGGGAKKSVFGGRERGAGGGGGDGGGSQRLRRER